LFWSGGQPGLLPNFSWQTQITRGDIKHVLHAQQWRMDTRVDLQARRDTIELKILSESQGLEWNLNTDA
jgi:hypothetical protein